MGFGWHTFNTVFATALATGRAIPAFLVFLVLLEILRPWRWRLGFSANGWNLSPRLPNHGTRWHQVNSALSRAGTQIKPRANMLLSPSA